MRALAPLSLLTVLFMPTDVGAIQIAPPTPPCPPNARCVPVRPIPSADRIARTSSNVRVTLDGRVLQYEITETLVNRGSTVGQADYMMPLPRGAAFEDLALEIDGELVTGETMTADRARGIYEEIVRRMRDPALVEWMDHGLLRTRVFPIAPGETKRIVVRFRAVAEREGNALRVDYVTSGRAPGATEAWAAPTFTLVLPRGDAFGAPYSPTHQLETSEPRNPARGGREVRVVGDASRLTLLLPMRNSANATVTVLPFAPPGEDGYSLIQLSPPARRGATLPRDVTFVVDVSGSMSGAKLEQARAAGLTLLNTLMPVDRFRLIAFASDVQSFRDGWTPAASAQLRDAREWLEDLRASGSTNISGALESALEARATNGRLGIVLFLTDGAATVGERNPERLVEMAAARRGGHRVFAFGVGADVQAAMLERIALEGRGTAHFVQPNEDVEHAVGVVAQRLTSPVATNVRVRAEGVRLRQVHPANPQDLFVGQDLTLFARYDGSGPVTLVFEGDSPDGPVRWTERVTFPERSRENAFVAKLWAVQRVGWLSAERRRNGANPELDAELRELGIKYGIPTELSSYLVLEPGMQATTIGARALPLVEQGVAGAGGGRGAGSAQEFQAARMRAEQRAAKSLADVAASPPAVAGNADDRRDANGAVRQVGDRTFVFRDGRWTDTRMKDSVRKLTVQAYSPAYFALVDRLPDLKAMFALGEKVTVGGRAVTLVLDETGVTQLSTAELAAAARDW